MVKRQGVNSIETWLSVACYRDAKSSALLLSFPKSSQPYKTRVNIFTLFGIMFSGFPYFDGYVVSELFISEYVFFILFLDFCFYFSLFIQLVYYHRTLLVTFEVFSHLALVGRKC